MAHNDIFVELAQQTNTMVQHFATYAMAIINLVILSVNYSARIVRLANLPPARGRIRAKTASIRAPPAGSIAAAVVRALDPARSASPATTVAC